MLSRKDGLMVRLNVAGDDLVDELELDVNADQLAEGDRRLEHLGAPGLELLPDPEEDLDEDELEDEE